MYAARDLAVVVLPPRLDYILRIMISAGF